MGKDKNGSYQPAKGKPSGTGTRRGAIPPPPKNLESISELFNLDDSYGDEGNLQSQGIRVRHPNRNTDKDHGRKKGETAKESNRETNANNETQPDEIQPNLSRQALSELASYNGQAVTIYLPACKNGSENDEQKDITTFKGLLQQAAASLKSEGANPATILQPAYNLLENEQFWNRPCEGFAFFLGDGFFKYILLPASTQQVAFVNNSFMIAPLVPLLTNQDYFYLLVISKKQAKLFRANSTNMTFISVSELPNGMEDVIHFEEKGDQTLFRTGSSGAGGGANYHGMGGGKPDEKDNLAIYLAEVDNTLWTEVLSRENVPLLLAGVEYLIHIYKKLTKYKNVWEQALTGSHENENEHALYSQARSLLEPYFQERVNKAREKYGNQSATERTTSVVDDIIPAAYYKQIDCLFVQKNEKLWGHFDEVNNVLSIHDDAAPGDEELLDKAVIKTLLNGGDVFIVEKEQMPADSKLAAILRF